MNNKSDKVYIILLIMFLAGMMITAIAFCFKAIDKNAKVEESQGLIQVGKTDDFNIMYDKETKVMYIVHYRGGIEVMVNADGKPKLYNE